jgi:RNA polymerase sigma-70 factor, ECF subfamily
MPPPTPSDEDDVRRTLAGDTAAFARLFDRHARLVRAVVMAVSQDFNTIEDQTQETFLRAYRRLASLKDRSRFRSWLQAIARLVAKERRRQLDRDQRRRNPLDSQPLESSTTDDPSQKQVEQKEEQGRVLLAVAALPKRERLAIHAYYFHEQNADDAAVALGLSRSGFYAVLARATNRLRGQLSDQTRQTSPVERST